MCETVAFVHTKNNKWSCIQCGSTKHEKSSMKCHKKKGANPGQLFRAFGPHWVQDNLSLALLGLSSPCTCTCTGILYQNCN